MIGFVTGTWWRNITGWRTIAQLMVTNKRKQKQRSLRSHCMLCYCVYFFSLVLSSGYKYGVNAQCIYWDSTAIHARMVYKAFANHCGCTVCLLHIWLLC